MCPNLACYISEPKSKTNKPGVVHLALLNMVFLRGKKSEVCRGKRISGVGDTSRIFYHLKLLLAHGMVARSCNLSTCFESGGQRIRSSRSSSDLRIA